MGAGASAQLADQVSKDEARAFAGERWNEQMDIKFDTMATKGCVAKAVIEEHMSSKELRIMDWNAIAETASKLTDVQHVEAPPVLAVEVDNSKAVVKMQGLSRKHQAGLETKKKIATQINTSMEYAKERKENKLDSFIGKLAEKMPELETKVSAKDALLDTIDKMRKSGWPMNIDKGNHKGIDLPDPITKDSIIDLMDRLNDQARKEAKKKKHCNGVKDILHAKYALQIAVNYMDMVRKLPSVVHVSTALAGKITVVGDMHGQLRDLIQVFRHNGLPSFDNPYLFNGDLVDRGDYSAEVTLLLFGFAVADPGSIYINRGNHEDMTVCTGYGFVDELVARCSAAASRWVASRSRSWASSQILDARFSRRCSRSFSRSFAASAASRLRRCSSRSWAAWCMRRARSRSRSSSVLALGFGGGRGCSGRGRGCSGRGRGF